MQLTNVMFTAYKIFLLSELGSLYLLRSLAVGAPVPRAGPIPLRPCHSLTSLCLPSQYQQTVRRIDPNL